MKGTTSGLLAAVIHGVILSAGLTAGVWRLEQIHAARTLPTPQTEPVRIAPLHARPTLIDDARLAAILVKLQPRFGTGRPKINHVDHALRLWGSEATFADAECLSGVELRELLLDHRAFTAAWGPKTKPLLMPDTTGDDAVAFRTRSGAATASHVDHTLAGLAEIGTSADFPVLAPHGEFTVQDAIAHTLREFRLNQEEYEWSALVWLHYLPHVREWTTTEGQLVTWDRLAERLMRQRLSQGVCFGQHRLYALAAILQRDAETNLLTPPMRERVIEHLDDATRRLIATQHADGYWDGDWPGDEWDGPSEAATGPLGRTADRILATGHVLEWWLYAPAEVLPPDDVLARATDWLAVELEQLSPEETRRFYPFLTHAGRALALWHGVEPRQVELSPPERSPR